VLEIAKAVAGDEESLRKGISELYIRYPYSVVKDFGEQLVEEDKAQQSDYQSELILRHVPAKSEKSDGMALYAQAAK
jgi:hypothetical protein